MSAGAVHVDSVTASDHGRRAACDAICQVCPRSHQGLQRKGAAESLIVIPTWQVNKKLERVNEPMPHVQYPCAVAACKRLPSASTRVELHITG